MRKKVKSNFDFLKIAKLRDIFEKKKWTEIEEFDFFFENFCSMLEKLDENQTELLVDLTSDFLWVNYTDYYKFLKKTLLKLEDFDYLNLEKIYIIPMLSKSDREKKKTKSSAMVAYGCQNHQLKNIPLFKNSDFIILDDLEKLPNLNKIEANRYPILLIDDFIGTGDTAIEALEEILEIKNYKNTTLFIACLVCQSQGVEAINNKGYHTIYNIKRNKGISNKYSGIELNAKIEIMKSVELILATDKRFEQDYSFGYKESEALVTMTRTPNNTFPLYWFEAKLDKNNKWQAPFPR